LKSFSVKGLVKKSAIWSLVDTAK